MAYVTSQCGLDALVGPVADRRGNHRIDSLRNLMHEPRVALIHFVPGAHKALRVNGTARICVNEGLLACFAVSGRPAVCVLEIGIASVHFQCARALQRATLWNASSPSRDVPTPGRILDELSGGRIDGQRYDAELPERQARSLY